MTMPTGKFELKKFAYRKDAYQEGLEEILSLGFSPADYIHQFPLSRGI